MTLKEWSELTGILPTTSTTETGAMSVMLHQTVQGDSVRAQLTELEDYRVDSFSPVGEHGSYIAWLLPKTCDCGKCIICGKHCKLGCRSGKGEVCHNDRNYTIKIKSPDGSVLALFHVIGTIHLREANGVEVEIV